MEQAQIDQTITDVAADHGIKPGLLDYHVRQLHGWAPADVGFAEAVEEAAVCSDEKCNTAIAELTTHAFSPVPF